MALTEGKFLIFNLWHFDTLVVKKKVRGKFDTVKNEM
jgi:hypothetical protein